MASGHRRRHAAPVTTCRPGGARSGPSSQTPAYQDGQPGGAGHARRSAGSSTRLTCIGADQLGRVTAPAGTQAAKPISSSPAADRTRWFQVTHACQPSGARPHATSRAECGGRSRCTAMPAMTRLEHIYESIRGGGGGPVALTVSDPRQGESSDDQLEVPVVVCARGLPLPARGDCGRGALVAALRLVLPRCRRIARRAQPRRGPRDDLAVGADVHA
jgi:hypothetical protein